MKYSKVEVVNRSVHKQFIKHIKVSNTLTFAYCDICSGQGAKGGFNSGGMKGTGMMGNKGGGMSSMGGG